MSREIRFRVWDILNKRFISVDSLRIDSRGEYCEYDYWENGVYIRKDLWFDDKPEAFLQQYTGIRDKNDSPIYEGDILKFKWKPCDHTDCETWVGEVYWDEKLAAFLIEKTAGWSILEIKDYTVIGNICETPEMLKI